MHFVIILYRAPGETPAPERISANADYLAKLVTQSHVRVHEAALFSPEGGRFLDVTNEGHTSCKGEGFRRISGMMLLDCVDIEAALGIAQGLQYAPGTVVEVRPALRLLDA